ncbi:MAG TPA: diguanylate cyclase [Acidobacteriota bacterium]|nr:diguanylate cyclase [Acidobacteriota bacterium]
MAFDKEKSLKLAGKYVQQGKIAAAIEEYRKIAYADPYDLNILNTLGDLHAKNNQPEEAALQFLRVAESYRDSGQTNTAIAVYKKILKLNPSNIEIMLTLADLYTRQKLLIEARQLYLGLIDLHRQNGQNRQALRVMERIANNDPENAVLRFEIAAGYHLEGLNQEAFEFYLQAGQEFFRKGRDTEAVQSFQRALSITPDSKPARKLLVEALIRQGEIKTALGMLDYLLKRTPEDIDLIQLLGRTYLGAKMLESADATFTHLMTLDPNQYEALLEVGRAYADNKQFDHAITLIGRCLDTLLDKKQKKKATGLLKHILKANPNYLPALKLLANIYSRVREKRNLVATLNAIVEASLRQGLQTEASYALQQLMEAEPQETAHKEQLDTLEKKDDQESTAPTSNPDFPPGFEAASALSSWQRSFQAGGDNPFASGGTTSTFGGTSPFTTPARREPAEEISYEFSAELLEQSIAQNPEFGAARLKLLEDMVAGNPEYIEARLKLKELYLNSRLKERAALQCLEIARLYDAKNESESAKKLRDEAYTLHPGLKDQVAAPAAPAAPPAAALVESFAPAPVAERQFQFAPIESKPSEETNTEVMLALLGIASRRQFDKFLDREWRRAARNHVPIALVIVDIDYFRSFREGFGNQKGDDHLKAIAQTLNDELKRPGDLLGCYDHDQLIVLLPETPPDGALIVAEKLRAKIEALGLPNQRSPKGITTISLGLAALTPQQRATEASLIDAAELALYQAQRGGGNRVVSGHPL